MPEDRSLDDFADADAAAESASAESVDGAEEGTADPDGADEAEGGAGDEGVPADAADVDPAVATSTWHADGAACDRCGERVERRWRDEEAFVCADCASW